MDEGWIIKLGEATEVKGTEVDILKLQLKKLLFLENIT